MAGNAWNVTESEFRQALERSRDGRTSPEDSDAYWQLCRYYRGQIFYRHEAAKAVRLIRGIGDDDYDRAAEDAQRRADAKEGF